VSQISDETIFAEQDCALNITDALQYSTIEAFNKGIVSIAATVQYSVDDTCVSPGKGGLT